MGDSAHNDSAHNPFRADSQTYYPIKALKPHILKKMLTLYEAAFLQLSLSHLFTCHGPTFPQGTPLGSCQDLGLPKVPCRLYRILPQLASMGPPAPSVNRSFNCVSAPRKACARWCGKIQGNTKLPRRYSLQIQLGSKHRRGSKAEISNSIKQDIIRNSHECWTSLS